MTRVHDMGGRYGDGPVTPIPDEPLFLEPWHRKAMALTLAAGALGEWSIDAARFTREALAPKDYASFSYYEKWIAALADLLAARGLVTREELAGGAIAEAPLQDKALKGGDVAGALSRGSPSLRLGPDPRFRPGDRVRARLPAHNTLVEGGHTRLPAYAAGHVGVVVQSHGAHVFPDSNAHFLGEAPQPLYGVAFDATDLWGWSERAGDEVMIDLWESYLEPVA
ncbi:nitrile hydratase subunit beta [Acidimangrovimonas pyrenivorans]|uniref:Nitrile hydratase subunit beta n=1 Tax=Acidimangrovimonas pyrenivorans TaxID=2030798 RepID=A0ABV7AFL0_9RHOB